MFPLWQQHFHVANSAPTNPDELRSWVISEIWFLFFSWLVLTYHKATHSAWMPKFLPNCYQQGRGQGHTLCFRNPLFPTNHVAREKSHLKGFDIPGPTPALMGSPLAWYDRATALWVHLNWTKKQQQAKKPLHFTSLVEPKVLQHWVWLGLTNTSCRFSQ